MWPTARVTAAGNLRSGRRSPPTGSPPSSPASSTFALDREGIDTNPAPPLPRPGTEKAKDRKEFSMLEQPRVGYGGCRATWKIRRHEDVERAFQEEVQHRVPGALCLWTWTFLITRSPPRDLTAEISGFSQVPGWTLLCTCPGLIHPGGPLHARPLGAEDIAFRWCHHDVGSPISISRG